MRARTGCQACRDRHIKCVRRAEGDKCEKCFESNRECFNTALHRFKPVKSVLHKDRNGQTSRKTLTHDAMQVWVDVPTSVDFVSADAQDEEDAYDDPTSEAIGGFGEPATASLASGDIIEQAQRDPSDAIDPVITGSGNGWSAPLEPFHASSDYRHEETESHQAVLHDRTQSSHSAAPNFSPRSLPSPHATKSQSSMQQQMPQRTDLAGFQPLHRSNSARTPHFSSPRSFGASPQSSMRPGILNTSPGTLNSPAFSLSPCWPFQTSREANLFYHYVKNISPWIDVLDASGYFGREIPRRAAFQPLIANAIYALSSLHLSLLDGTEDRESPRYVDESLQHLKQILEDPLGHADENLLAGVILLRSHEEMSDKDENVHLLGGKRLLNSIASYAADGGFKESASWISLRQHIYISLTTESPLGLNLSNYEHSSVFVDQSDEAWANRAVFLFACVLNYIFGSENEGHSGRHDAERWAELEAEIEAWNVSKPWYFSALWTQTSQERVGAWPEVQTSHPTHAVGLQYYSLCKIVLAIYDPRLSRLGFSSHRLRMASENTVREHLRLAVGIAVSNPDVTNAMFQGSHILAVCGSYLHDREDQDAAIQFLQAMHKSMGWRTAPIVESLKEQWAG